MIEASSSVSTAGASPAARGPVPGVVNAGAGNHWVTAHVTFRDATRAKTMRLRYRACAAAALRPRAGPVAVHRMNEHRPSGLRRGVTAALVIAAGTVFAAPAQAAAPRVSASEPLVEILRDHVAHDRPNGGSRRIEDVTARRPLTRVRTVLPVLGSATSSAGDAWLQVRLPGRPNGHKGWIRAEDTKQTTTGWQHLGQALDPRRVTVYRDGRVARRFRAVVGTPATPTPTGKFFIEEAVALAPGHAGGPFALATSARSNVLQEFEGGPGQIALHGTAGLAGAPGSASSHGCIRLSTRAITWLARRIGAGVPLVVTR